LTIKSFTTTSLSAITNLAGDFAVDIIVGDKLEYLLTSIGKTSGTDRSSVPGGHNPNVWAISIWMIPNWANTDGVRHFIAQIRLDSSNHVDIEKTAAGAILVTVVAGGVSRSATLTLSFSSGETVFVGVSLDGLAGALAQTGSHLTIFADTDDDNVLEVDVGADDVPEALFAGAYELHLGSDFEGSYSFDGAINFCILNDGSNVSIFDRFGAGNGLALEGEDSWLSRYVDYLVLCVSGTATTPLADSRAGAVDFLEESNPSQGAYQFTAANFDRINFGHTNEWDGVTEATFYYEFKKTAVVDNWTQASLFPNTPEGDRQWGSTILVLGELLFVVTIDGAGNNGQSRVGTRYASLNQRIVWVVRYDGAGVGDAGRVQQFFALYNEETRSYGPIKQIAASEITNPGEGAIPASFRTPSGTQPLMFGTLADLVFNFSDGIMYETRFLIGEALTIAEIEDLVPGEFVRSQWTHRWVWDGNADDQIGTLNGTPEATTGDGPDQVADDRGHHKAEFDHFIEEGVYTFDGIDDLILTADPGAGADGLSKAAWALWVRNSIIDAGLATIFGRWDGADNQFRIARNGADIRVYISSGGASAADFADFTVGMKRNEKWKFVVVYEGGVGNEVTLYAYLFDEARGQWGGRQTPAPSITGTIPNTLASSALGYVWADGEFRGEVDETRIWNGVILTALEVDRETIYHNPKGGVSHRWLMDGNAKDLHAGLNGVVSGAINTPDFRKPFGYILSGIGEIERTRGTVLRLPGVAGDYASIASSSALDFTNDRFEAWFDIALQDWSPTVTDDTLLSRWTTVGNQRGFRIFVNSSGGGSLIVITWSGNGTDLATQSTPTLISSFLNDTQRLKIRVQLDVNDPDSLARVWTRESDFDPWISIFNSNAVGLSNIHNSTAPLEFGTQEGGTLEPLQGRYFSCRLWDGLRSEGAPLIVSADFTRLRLGQTSFEEDAQALKVNLNGNAVVETGGVSVGDFRYRIKALNDHHPVLIKQDPSITPLSGRMNVIRAIAHGLPDSSGAVKIDPDWQSNLEAEILKSTFEQHATARRNLAGGSGINRYSALGFSEAYLDELRSLALDRVSPVKKRIIHV